MRNYNKIRILFYGIFVLILAFGSFKSFVGSSARGGLLDTYFFVSPKISNFSDFEKAGHNTAVVLWALFGKRVPSLSLQETYQMAFEGESYDENKFLINKKHICLANDQSCADGYLFKKAIEDKNYRQIFDILVEKYLFWCKGYFPICASSVNSAGYNGRGSKVGLVDDEKSFSYLPFGVYHFDKLSKGEKIYHKNNSNRFHVIGLFGVKSKGKDFTNYTRVFNWKNKIMEICINEDVEDVDVIFTKTSYGHGFPYLYPYGYLNRVYR